MLFISYLFGNLLKRFGQIMFCGSATVSSGLWELCLCRCRCLVFYVCKSLSVVIKGDLNLQNMTVSHIYICILWTDLFVNSLSWYRIETLGPVFWSINTKLIEFEQNYGFLDHFSVPIRLENLAHNSLSANPWWETFPTESSDESNVGRQMGR